MVNGTHFPLPVILLAYLVWAGVGAAGSSTSVPIWNQIREFSKGECIQLHSHPRAPKGLEGVVIGPLVVTLFVGVGLGALLLAAFRTIPRGMVYFVVFAGIFAPAIAALTLLVGNKEQSETTGVGLFLFGTSGVSAFLFIKFRGSVTLTTKLLKETSIALQDNWLLARTLSISQLCFRLFKLSLKHAGTAFYLASYYLLDLSLDPHTSTLRSGRLGLKVPDALAPFDEHSYWPHHCDCQRGRNWKV